MEMKTKEAKEIRKHLENQYQVLKDLRDEYHEKSWAAKVKRNKLENNGRRGTIDWYKQQNIIDECSKHLDFVGAQIIAYRDLLNYVVIDK